LLRRRPLRTVHARSHAHGPSRPRGRFRTFLNRLEYSASQPPYCSRRPLVRSPKCSTCRWFRRMRLLRFKGPTCPRQHPFRGRAPGPVSGQLCRQPPEEFPTVRSDGFPAAFRPPAFASWAPCPARRNSAPITVGLPPPVRIPAHLRRTLAGFTRFTRVRPGPGRRLSLPRG